MRIALMTNNYKPFLAGVPISVERLAKGLESLGHEVTVFAPTYEEQTEEEDVFRYATWMKKFIGGVVLPNPLDRRIEQEFRNKQFDIIHVHHPMLIGRTAVYLSKKYHIPLVFTYHTRYEQYLSYVKGIRWLEDGSCRKGSAFHKQRKWMLHTIQDRIVPAYIGTFLKHCDFVFAPTKGIQDYLTDVCKFPYDKTDILPTGIENCQFQVDETAKTAVRKEWKAENIPLLISVSRMAHEKNVGFLFASKTEIQGIVILEAMAGGTPVCAVDATGVSDIVQDGVNGFLSPESVEIYTSKLISFLKGEADKRQLAQNAFATALQYREEAVAAKAIHLYNRIIVEKYPATDKGCMPDMLIVK